MREGVRTPAAATSVYPDTYIKDKPPAEFQAFSKAPAQPPPVAEPLLPSPAQPGTGTAPRTPAKSRAPGRRRAKRSLVQSLWPFQAFTRPASATSTSAHIRSRSTTATVLRKLRADRAAVLAGWTIVVLILLAVFAPVVTGLFGVSPTALHPELTDATFGPHGGLGGISWSHPLGVDQRLGRDVMARLLFGARVSLLIACGATLLSVSVGVGLGIVSGYLGGRVDLVVMRIADVFLAFPLILFALGLTGALSDQAFGLSGNALRIAIMIFVMGFFNWPYIAASCAPRCSRCGGGSSSTPRGPWAPRPGGSSDGNCCRTSWRRSSSTPPCSSRRTSSSKPDCPLWARSEPARLLLGPDDDRRGRHRYTDPSIMIVPGLAVLIPVLAFNLFGDGLRDAPDPTAP